MQQLLIDIVCDVMQSSHTIQWNSASYKCVVMQILWKKIINHVRQQQKSYEENKGESHSERVIIKID